MTSLPLAIPGHPNSRGAGRRLHRHLKAEQAGAITQAPDLAGRRPQSLFQQPCHGILPGPHTAGTCRRRGGGFPAPDLQAPTVALFGAGASNVVGDVYRHCVQHLRLEPRAENPDAQGAESACFRDPGGQQHFARRVGDILRRTG